MRSNLIKSSDFSRIPPGPCRKRGVFRHGCPETPPPGPVSLLADHLFGGVVFGYARDYYAFTALRMWSFLYNYLICKCLT